MSFQYGKRLPGEGAIRVERLLLLRQADEIARLQRELRLSGIEELRVELDECHGEVVRLRTLLAAKQQQSSQERGSSAMPSPLRIPSASAAPPPSPGRPPPHKDPRRRGWRSETRDGAGPAAYGRPVPPQPASAGAGGRRSTFPGAVPASPGAAASPAVAVTAAAVSPGGPSSSSAGRKERMASRARRRRRQDQQRAEEAAAAELRQRARQMELATARRRADMARDVAAIARCREERLRQLALQFARRRAARGGGATSPDPGEAANRQDRREDHVDLARVVMQWRQRCRGALREGRGFGDAAQAPTVLADATAATAAEPGWRFYLGVLGAVGIRGGRAWVRVLVGGVEVARTAVAPAGAGSDPVWKQHFEVAAMLMPAAQSGSAVSASVGGAFAASVELQLWDDAGFAGRAVLPLAWPLRRAVLELGLAAPAAAGGGEAAGTLHVVVGDAATSGDDADTWGKADAIDAPAGKVGPVTAPARRSSAIRSGKSGSVISMPEPAPVFGGGDGTSGDNHRTDGAVRTDEEEGDEDDIMMAEYASTSEDSAAAAATAASRRSFESGKSGGGGRASPFCPDGETAVLSELNEESRTAAAGRASRRSKASVDRRGGSRGAGGVGDRDRSTEGGAPVAYGGHGGGSGGDAFNTEGVGPPMPLLDCLAAGPSVFYDNDGADEREEMSSGGFDAANGSGGGGDNGHRGSGKAGDGKNGAIKHLLAANARAGGSFGSGILRAENSTSNRRADAADLLAGGVSSSSGSRARRGSSRIRESFPLTAGTALNEEFGEFAGDGGVSAAVAAAEKAAAEAEWAALRAREAAVRIQATERGRRERKRLRGLRRCASHDRRAAVTAAAAVAATAVTATVAMAAPASPAASEWPRHVTPPGAMLPPQTWADGSGSESVSDVGFETGSYRDAALESYLSSKEDSPPLPADGSRQFDHGRGGVSSGGSGGGGGGGGEGGGDGGPISEDQGVSTAGRSNSEEEQWCQEAARTIQAGLRRAGVAKQEGMRRREEAAAAAKEPAMAPESAAAAAVAIAAVKAASAAIVDAEAAAVEEQAAAAVAAAEAADQSKAARFIQAGVRSRLAKRGQERREKAAVAIQAGMRGGLARRCHGKGFRTRNRGSNRRNCDGGSDDSDGAVHGAANDSRSAVKASLPNGASEALSAAVAAVEHSVDGPAAAVAANKDDEHLAAARRIQATVQETHASRAASAGAAAACMAADAAVAPVAAHFSPKDDAPQLAALGTGQSVSAPVAPTPAAAVATLSTPLAAGARATARYHGKDYSYPCASSAVQRDSACDLLCNDGDHGERTKPSLARPLLHDTAAAATAAAGESDEEHAAAARRIQTSDRQRNARKAGEADQGRAKTVAETAAKAAPGSISAAAATPAAAASTAATAAAFVPPTSPATATAVVAVPVAVSAVAPAALVVGARAEARYRGRPRYYPCVVTAVKADGTCDVRYDDGDVESGIHLLLVRPLQSGSGGDGGGGANGAVVATAAAAVPSAPGSPATVPGVFASSSAGSLPLLTVGGRAEARYRGKSRYYPCVVTAVHGDGSCNLLYDDGDTEEHVEPLLVRQLGGVPAAAAAAAIATAAVATAAVATAAVVLEAPSAAAVAAALAEVEELHTTTGSAAAGTEGRTAPEVTTVTEAPRDLAQDSAVSRCGSDAGAAGKATFGPPQPGASRIMTSGSGAAATAEATPQLTTAAAIAQPPKVAAASMAAVPVAAGAVAGPVVAAAEAAAVAPAPAAAAVAEAAQFSAGSRVEARYRGRDRYFPANVTAVSPDGAVDLQYDLGVKEQGVVLALVRPLPAAASAATPAQPVTGAPVAAAAAKTTAVAGAPAAPASKAATVELPAAADDAVSPAAATASPASATASLAGTAMPVRAAVTAGLSAAAGAPAAAVAAEAAAVGELLTTRASLVATDSAAAAAAAVGEAAETIIGTNASITSPAAVPDSGVTVVATATAVVAVSAPAASMVAVGARVEARYRGKARYFRGRVMRVNTDSTLDVRYDNGDVESGVDVLLVRLLDDGIAAETATVEKEARTLDAIADSTNAAPATANGITVATVTAPTVTNSAAARRSPLPAPGTPMEARYRGGSRYYPGVVTAVHADGSCDVRYDDGDEEIYMPRDLLRFPDDEGGSVAAAAEPAAPGASSAADSAVTPAAIAKAAEAPVAASFAAAANSTRMPGAPAASAGAALLTPGSRVEARYRGRARYFRGVVTAANGDGTFDVRYDDGETESGIDPGLVRLLAGRGTAAVVAVPAEAEATLAAAAMAPVAAATGAAAQGAASETEDTAPRAAAASPQPAFPAGALVDARYRGGARFFPGVVVAVYPDGTCDVTYDDGDYEMRVAPEMLRSRPATAAVSGPVPAAAASVEELAAVVAAAGADGITAAAATVTAAVGPPKRGSAAVPAAVEQLQSPGDVAAAAEAVASAAAAPSPAKHGVQQQDGPEGGKRGDANERRSGSGRSDSSSNDSGGGNHVEGITQGEKSSGDAIADASSGGAQSAGKLFLGSSVAKAAFRDVNHGATSALLRDGDGSVGGEDNQSAMGLENNCVETGSDDAASPVGAGIGSEAPSGALHSDNSDFF